MYKKSSSTSTSLDKLHSTSASLNKTSSNKISTDTSTDTSSDASLSKICHEDECIKNIADLAKQLNILCFSKNKNGKWKLKTEEEIINIIDNKNASMHSDLCQNIKILHNIRNYNQVSVILKEHQKILVLLDNILILIKKFYVNKLSKPIIIEYFSTQNK